MNNNREEKPTLANVCIFLYSYHICHNNAVSGKFSFMLSSTFSDECICGNQAFKTNDISNVYRRLMRFRYAPTFQIVCVCNDYE